MYLITLDEVFKSPCHSNMCSVFLYMVKTILAQMQLCKIPNYAKSPTFNMPLSQKTV